MSLKAHCTIRPRIEFVNVSTYSDFIEVRGADTFDWSVIVEDRFSRSGNSPSEQYARQAVQAVIDHWKIEANIKTIEFEVDL